MTAVMPCAACSDASLLGSASTSDVKQRTTCAREGTVMLNDNLIQSQLYRGRLQTSRLIQPPPHSILSTATLISRPTG